MFHKFEISGLQFEVDKPLRKYITKKLAYLDRYIPRRSRSSAHLGVRLKKSRIDGKIKSVCEVVMYLPHETINLTESSINMYSVVDITKTKLKYQLKKYKDELMVGKQRRHILGRLEKRFNSRIPDFGK